MSDSPSCLTEAAIDRGRPNAFFPPRVLGRVHFLDRSWISMSTPHWSTANCETRIVVILFSNQLCIDEDISLGEGLASCFPFFAFVLGRIDQRGPPAMAERFVTPISSDDNQQHGQCLDKLRYMSMRFAAAVEGGGDEGLAVVAALPSGWGLLTFNAGSSPVSFPRRRIPPQSRIPRHKRHQPIRSGCVSRVYVAWDHVG
ncbi:hypothetical protein LZ30DRAFT_184033 [Colletotrichum cereale]|nr:hypothetical protein LZ30DRAFT_184033 [Colletotrichum cereale]